ncbi:MAG: FAD-binding oxidoreductase [Candidatus Lokiarchaeia archaeon]
MSRVLRALEDAVGSEYVSDEDFVLYSYSRVVDGALERRPEFVVKPRTTEEVAKVVRVANRYKIPIVPRGGGCDLVGGSKPIEVGGIVLDTLRMNKILDINENTLTVTVEIGITWAGLNSKLNEMGYYTGNLGPGSGMSAAIGGGLSNNSMGGGGAARYGTCTEQCLALEVVLPNGNIINTGSNAGVYTKEPFCRFGFGPDLTGLFLGDTGIMGIKTKATLKIYPKPEYHECKTFTLEEPSPENTTKIWLDWRKGGELGIYDSFYLPQLMVLGMIGGLAEITIFKPWKGINKAIFWYTMEAETPEELEANVKKVDETVKKYGGEELGPEIKDGNYAKWHYEEQGHWLNWHGLWGGLGPGSVPCSVDFHVPIHQFPYIFKKVDEWGAVHGEELAKAGAMTGVSNAFLGSHTTVIVDAGLLVWDKPELRELNKRLWVSQVQFMLKEGVMPINLGEIMSRALIDTGALIGSYYEFLKSVKDALDPNGILSPGKFHL